MDYGGKIHFFKYLEYVPSAKKNPAENYGIKNAIFEYFYSCILKVMGKE